MTLAKSYLKQIEDITSFLIGRNLSVSQNFPSLNIETGILYVTDKDFDMSISQRNISFREIYDTLDQQYNYNIKLIDGGLLQLNYMFNIKEDSILRHRLAYFPSPHLATFQDSPSRYDDDELYADILRKNILPVPVRFDYDPEVNKNKQPEDFESIHPHSHVTFGQYQNCRIAVSNLLSPSMFIEFVLKSFYGSFYYREIFRKEALFVKHQKVETCITDFEKTSIHLSISIQ
ncbi:DUF2290 domain-containing protein [Olivibacter sp. LS-1]|uniref:DUF2290 domain-containing protein n=1 Tax=Olivibacter sp. LS-1 TaxID=2592345 RepID=UPI0011EAE620|nr:DUF2290 domain-containing protein [Olivibacter sp. LS-1]QEL03445.1 DUF2290 domain-containing protein [Olivibacter sp. LS-1]